MRTGKQIREASRELVDDVKAIDDGVAAGEITQAQCKAGHWPGIENGNRATRRAQASKARSRVGRLEDLVARMRASNKRLRQQLADAQPAA
jgi:HAMP domain-containing protein